MKARPLAGFFIFHSSILNFAFPLEFAPMKLAFIGLGAMGFPMARHLAKQHDVLVWNRTREKAERHAREHGSHLARDLGQCAEAEVIITMLPTSREVDEIVDQLLPHLRRG